MLNFLIGVKFFWEKRLVAERRINLYCNSGGEVIIYSSAMRMNYHTTLHKVYLALLELCMFVIYHVRFRNRSRRCCWVLVERCHPLIESRCDKFIHPMNPTVSRLYPCLS
jgi:hypothetical protein